MKTLLILLLAATAQAQIVPAGPNSYNGNLVNIPGLAYSNTYTIDMAPYSGSKVSAQVNFSTEIFSSPTFLDGAQSTGSITISSYSALLGQVLNIGGTLFTGGVSFTTVTSNNVTATSLASAINSSSLGLTASASANIVYATSTINGAAYNYAMTTTTQAAMGVSGAKFVNGVTPGYTLGSGLFSGTATSFTLGVPVLWAIGANPAIGGLTTGTTYYAVPVGSNAFQLAKYSTSAVAGVPASDFITVTSSSTQLLTSEHTYTVAPAVWNGGAATFVWQSSDDNTNFWTAASTGTVTVYSTTTATTLPIDFSSYNYRYLRLKYVSPALGFGGVNIVAPVNVKQDGIGPF